MMTLVLATSISAFSQQPSLIKHSFGCHSDEIGDVGDFVLNMELVEERRDYYWRLVSVNPVSSQVDSLDYFGINSDTSSAVNSRFWVQIRKIDLNANINLATGDAIDLNGIEFTCDKVPTTF